MLRPITRGEFEQWVGFAYQLARDPQRSAYPSYAEGQGSREDFLAASQAGLDAPNEQILLYLEEEAVRGWIHSFVLPEDAYLSFISFNVAGDYAAAIAQFISYAARQHPGFTVDLGLSCQNKAAIAWLEQEGWPCIERSMVHAQRLANLAPASAAQAVLPVDRKNFPLFQQLHAPQDAVCYWTSDRLQAQLVPGTRWRLRLYMPVGQQTPRAAIHYCMDGQLMEIYGLDYRDQRFDEQAAETLLREAVEGARSAGAARLLYLTESEAEHGLLKRLDIPCIDRYRLYRNTL